MSTSKTHKQAAGTHTHIFLLLLVHNLGVSVALLPHSSQHFHFTLAHLQGWFPWKRL